jgi:cytoskeletal protein RodZ
MSVLQMEARENNYLEFVMDTQASPSLDIPEEHSSRRRRSRRHHHSRRKQRKKLVRRIGVLFFILLVLAAMVYVFRASGGESQPQPSSAIQLNTNVASG